MPFERRESFRSETTLSVHKLARSWVPEGGLTERRDKGKTVSGKRHARGGVDLVLVQKKSGNIIYSIWVINSKYPTEGSCPNKV